MEIDEVQNENYIFQSWGGVSLQCGHNEEEKEKKRATVCMHSNESTIHEHRTLIFMTNC